MRQEQPCSNCKQKNRKWMYVNSRLTLMQQKQSCCMIEIAAATISNKRIDNVRARHCAYNPCAHRHSHLSTRWQAANHLSADIHSHTVVRTFSKLKQYLPC
eukprot:1161282-Pelagomonas_calceolata.AAC.2